MTASFGTTRRGFLRGSTALAVIAAFSASSWAQDMLDDTGDQAEWVQSYDAATSKALDRSTVPLLSPGTISATEAAVENFKIFIAKGGWPPVPNVPLKLGMQDPAVIDLRKINRIGRSRSGSRSL